MTRRLFACCAVLLAGSVAAGWTSDVAAIGDSSPQGRGGRGGRVARKRVLAWADTRNGQAQHESVGHALAIIERLGYESGQWDTFIRTDSNIISKTPKKTDGSPASGGPTLSNVDAIFFMGHREVPLDPSQREELLSFVRDGKGFVAAHVGLTAFESWPEFLDLIGARFDGHPWTQTFTADVLDASHPACAHLGSEWRWHDEVYQFRDLRADAQVLLRVRDGELDLSASGARPPEFGYPLAWCFAEGAGRVFSTSLGHFPNAWETPAYLQHLSGGLGWALGAAA